MIWARQPRTDIAAVTTPRASSDPIEDELRAARGEPRTFSSAPHGFKCKMRRVSRVHARVVHYCSSVASRTRDGHAERGRARGACSVATESEYIGLKASRRSVTYTHLTACTHSSSHERTNNARTSSAREVGHERTAIALPASSHLGDRRVTAHGAFTYTHAPRRRVFAHTRGAVRVRTYLRVRTRRCVLAGNRQTSWLEWGRGGGGTGQHGVDDTTPCPFGAPFAAAECLVSCPLARVHATSPGRPSQHNQSTAKL
jgi:hypothetical protein